MRLIEKILTLFGWAFVLTLGALMLVISSPPIIGLLIHCAVTRQTPREVVELVFSH